MPMEKDPPGTDHGRTRAHVRPERIQAPDAPAPATHPATTAHGMKRLRRGKAGPRRNPARPMKGKKPRRKRKQSTTSTSRYRREFSAMAEDYSLPKPSRIRPLSRSFFIKIRAMGLKMR
jgi:hypothetical protein